MKSACYTPRLGVREGNRERSGVMPRLRLAVTSGVDHFPGFLDRAAEEALRDEILAILREAPASSGK